MLGSHDESVRRYAVTTLHNLLLYLEPAKEDIIALGQFSNFWNYRLRLFLGFINF
jgi:hypothetical protein